MSHPWDDPMVERVTKAFALSECRGERQAAHAMFYSKSENVLFERIPMRYNVLMVMRFDGNLGFPGGFVNTKDGSETIESGLNRELMEEINLEEKHFINSENYVGSYIHSAAGRKFLNHFYLKEVSELEYETIEKQSLSAIEWGKETLGIINVPVQRGVGLSRTYLPIVDFLQNKFIGNAKQELVEGLHKAGIFSEKELADFFKTIQNEVKKG